MPGDHETVADPPGGATAVDDPRLEPFRGLKDAHQRQLGRFIIESERVLERCVALGFAVESVLVTTTRWRRLTDVLLPMGDAVVVAEQSVVDATIGFSLPRGVVALAHRPDAPDLDAVLSAARRVVVLENVVDPDNVGSVFRHAAAFGADAVLVSEHAGDPLYRKAVRSSMGWVLDVPWLRVADRDDPTGALHRHGFTTLAFSPSGDVDLRAVRSSGGHERVAIVLGAESDGLLETTMAACHHRVRIDIAAHVDSLNVATTAALAMFELFGPSHAPTSP